MSNFEQYRCWWKWHFSSSEDFRYFSLDWKNCFIIISFWIKKHSSCLKKVAVCLDSSPVVASSTLLFLKDVFHLLLTHNTKLLPLEEDQKLCRGTHLKLVLGVTALCPLLVLQMQSYHPVFIFMAFGIWLWFKKENKYKNRNKQLDSSQCSIKKIPWNKN